MDWVTTTTILDRLGDAGDHAAWRRIAERFRRPIMAYARRAGLNDSDAEDVAQETLAAFAAAYADGRYDRELGRLNRWIFGIAHRQVQRARVRKARLPVSGRGDSVWGDAHARSAPPDDERTWDQAIVDACLDEVARELPAETLRLFLATVRDDRTAADVARDFGVDVKRVYNVKHRVLGRIREIRRRLEENE